MTRAIDFLNTRYRVPLGLPPIRWEPQIAVAARNHTRYMLVNDVYDHEETPGTPGFTGIRAWNRCQAAGGPLCGEVIDAVGDITAAMSAWMNTPYHGKLLIETAQLGCAANAKYATCDVAQIALPISKRPAAPANAPDSPVRVWPFDGATDVPLSWNGGEIPDPLENYGGDRHVGPTLYFYVDSTKARITLYGPGSTVIPLLVPDASYPTNTLAVTESGWQFAFPVRALLAHARYRIVIVTADGRVRTVRFTTGADTTA